MATWSLRQCACDRNSSFRRKGRCRVFSFCLPAVVITIASSEAGAVRKGDRKHVPRKKKEIWEAWNTIFRRLLLFRLKCKASNRLNAPRVDTRQLKLPYPTAKNNPIPRSVDTCNQGPHYLFSSIYWISHSPKISIPRPSHHLRFLVATYTRGSRTRSQQKTSLDDRPAGQR